MKKQLIDYDLIERFLEDSLNDEQRKSFDELLKSDKAFAEALAKRQLLQNSYIEATKRIEIKKKIHAVILDEKRKTINHRKVWLAAASIAILLGIGSFFMFQQKPSLDNTTVAKQDSLLQEDILVSPNKNTIVEFGTADTLHKQNETITTFLPADDAVFYQTDTIRFSRPKTDGQDVLTILDKNGLVVINATMIPGISEYKVIPHSLKPGKYTWSFLNENIPNTLIIK